MKKRAILIGCSLWLIQLTELSRAYIPAQPSNESRPVQSGVNVTQQGSMLELQWFPNASFTQEISYQLTGADSTGVDKGALVHFSEALSVTNVTTLTPWIAFISCDSNGTRISADNDIFSIAKERGAVAAILYSEWSEVCVLNAEFTDPTHFDHVLDVFTPLSLTSSRTVQNVFANVPNFYEDFNATLLNTSANTINDIINSGIVPSQTFVFATLSNSSATSTSTEGGNGSASSSMSGKKSADIFLIAALSNFIGLSFILF